MEVWGDQRVLKLSVESDFKLLGYATCQLALKKTVREMTALGDRCTDLGPQLGPSVPRGRGFRHPPPGLHGHISPQLLGFSRARPKSFLLFFPGTLTARIAR